MIPQQNGNWDLKRNPIFQPEIPLRSNADQIRRITVDDKPQLTNFKVIQDDQFGRGVVILLSIQFYRL